LGPRCGDDIVQKAAGESCDDGNRINHDGCSATCKLEDPK
jgi:cysteine-rich repeat protein